MKNQVRPITLIVLDGWGYREEIESNAIAQANTPFWDKMWREHPHTLIYASEKAVGLPNDQMGNSEVGHLNLGAGRVVFQEILRIGKSIQDGSFKQNKAIAKAVKQAVDNDKAVHILGLLSDGGVHSHQDHIVAMVQAAAEQGANKIYVHGFFDGRDAPPKSAEAPIQLLEDCFKSLGKGQFASVIGRYYAMDRDNRWERTQAAYELIAKGTAKHQAASAAEALQIAYDAGLTDEFVESTSIVGEGNNPVTVEDGDAVIYMNFRSDRARQLTRAFIEPEFKEFPKDKHVELVSFVTLTRYHQDFDTPVAFDAQKLKNVFGDYVSQLGLKQLRIAETEKYAHVTFFLNGGREEPFPGEDRILVPSPKVATYDQQPEMNAELLTEKLVEAINSDTYDFIICNFANPDMVGHTGNFDATVKAIEKLDQCLEKVITAIKKTNGEALITADHGNAEFMQNPKTGQAHTAHTTNPVPFVFVGRDAELADTGALSDVTPTMLYLRGLDKPPEMDGNTLVTLKNE